MNEQKKDVFSRAQRSLTSWRSGKRAGDRIPEGIWRRAVKLAELHGVSKTAKELSLGFYELRSRLEETRAARGSSIVQRFVEVSPSRPVEPPGCVIEVEDGAGARVRVVLNGPGVSQAAAVVSAVWGAAVR